MKIRLKMCDVVLRFSNLTIFFFFFFPVFLPFSQIEEEFQRITLKPLLSVFMRNLDLYTPKLLSLFRSKGGALGKKLGEMLEVLNKVSTCNSVVVS